MKKKQRLEKPWDIHPEVGKAMNQVAQELGIESSIVREVLTKYYQDIKGALTDPKVPEVELHGITRFKPVPLFIKRRISRLEKEGTKESLIKAKKLNVVRFREIKERNRKAMIFKLRNNKDESEKN